LNVGTTEQNYALIKSLVDQITTSDLQTYIQDLQNFNTRYALSPNIDSARDYIISKFSATGCTITTQAFLAGNVTGGRTVYNVIGELKGKSVPEDVYILCAHYDSTSADGMNSAPGADDNATGCAALLACAKVLFDKGP